MTLKRVHTGSSTVRWEDRQNISCQDNPFTIIVGFECNDKQWFATFRMIENSKVTVFRELCFDISLSAGANINCQKFKQTFEFELPKPLASATCPNCSNAFSGNEVVDIEYSF